jgi:hypothetical protein
MSIKRNNEGKDMELFNDSEHTISYAISFDSIKSGKENWTGGYLKEGEHEYRRITFISKDSMFIYPKGISGNLLYFYKFEGNLFWIKNEKGIDHILLYDAIEKKDYELRTYTRKQLDSLDWKIQFSDN